MKSKPRFSTQGQAPGKSSGSPNRAGGGAPGQKVSNTKNTYREPRFGTRGQKKAGS